MHLTLPGLVCAGAIQWLPCAIDLLRTSLEATSTSTLSNAIVGVCVVVLSTSAPWTVPHGGERGEGYEAMGDRDEITRVTQVRRSEERRVGKECRL